MTTSAPKKEKKTMMLLLKKIMRKQTTKSIWKVIIAASTMRVRHTRTCQKIQAPPHAVSNAAVGGQDARCDFPAGRSGAGCR